MALKHLEPLNEDWSKGMERYKVALKNGEEIDVKVKEGEGLAKVEQILAEEELEYQQITKKASRPTLTEKKKPGPDGYMTGLSDEDEEDKKDQMKKQAAMDDDDPDAYKEMPGDKEAREKGKVKKSKFTTAYHKKFKKNEMKNLQELETFIADLKATKEAQRIENIKNTKLSTRLKTIDEFLSEGLMGDLHQMAGEAKDEDKFVKTFFSDYGDKIKKSKDSEEWVRSLYRDTVNEAYIGPFVFNDKMSDEELKDMYDAALDGYANYSRGFQHPKSKYKKAYQEIEKILKKRGVSVDEAFIGPFVFNDKMSDEKLKDMYDAALDGYANYSRGFQHPKSDYKKAYQEIEKILKKRGVSVDEGTLYGNEVAIYMGEDGETRIEKRGRGYYGYNDEFDFTAKNKRELEQKLRGWGYYLIAGSLDEAVELVHVYKDGELYGTGELVKGKDKKIKGKKHQLIRFDGSTEDYYPVEDIKLVESINEDYEKHLDRTYGRNRDYSTITVQDLHFQTDAEELEKMKLAYGYRMGGVTSRERIEDADYSLRRYRKDIKYGDGKDVGVFLPGSYAAATSKLGDGPHKKATPKVKWNQRKYDQWIEDVASNDGWKHAYDMAQNAKNAPGLIDWVKKNNRGEDPLQVIQWDIEAMAESVSEEYEAVGKYNTVKKVMKELGRRPSEQELATFITKNYRDVTGVERGEDDPMANDKIADLVSFYKFDIDDWSIAWSDAQNESVNEDRNTKYTRELTKIFRKEFEDFPFGYYQDGKDYQANKRIIIEPEGFNPDGTLFDMKDDWREDIIRVVRKHKKKWHIAPNMGGGLTIHIKESVNEKKSWTLVRPGKGYVRKMTVNDYVKDIKHGVKFKTIKSAEQGAEYFNRFHRIDDVVVQAVDESVNEKKELPKEIAKHKDIPSWARYVAQHSDGEWTWYEETPTMIRFKSGGGAWKQDGNQIYTGVKTDGKDWDKMPTYYYVKNGKITESTDEKEQTNLKNLQTLESFVGEKKKQTNDQSPLDDDGMETGIKNKAKESGVPVGLLRIIMRRGLAAWKTGHRPGATQAQWGYARVNSFLTKQDGTWGGADADIAKKVRDGGHDKKL